MPQVKRIIFLLLLSLSVTLMAQNLPSRAAGTGTAYHKISPHKVVGLLKIDGAIGPGTSEYIQNGLTIANKERMRAAIIQLDTPGGLDKSMRRIVKAILASPVPVLCWVAPGGARAASAGTFIVYACGLAAMAPGTNIGAATPVSIGLSGSSHTPAVPQTAEQRKILNDAIAYIQSLAQLHHRNSAWAAKAVRDAATLTAKGALSQGVVNVVAATMPELIQSANGKTVATSNGSKVLNLKGARIQAISPSWTNTLLAVITEPTIAYLLFLGGLFGLLIEGFHPGIYLPGILGAISLLLALYAFQLLPINYAGLALILLGVGLFITEAFIPSFGAFGVGGITAFVFGSVILMNTRAPGYRLPWYTIGSISGVGGLALLAIIWAVVRSRRRPIVSGMEQMVGSEAVALEDFEASGLVRVHGERWRAQSHTPVKTGDILMVEAINGLTLTVKPKVREN